VNKELEDTKTSGGSIHSDGLLESDLALSAGENILTESKSSSLMPFSLNGLNPDEAIFKLHYELGWEYNNALHFVKHIWKKESIDDVIYFPGIPRL